MILLCLNYKCTDKAVIKVIPLISLATIVAIQPIFFRRANGPLGQFFESLSRLSRSLGDGFRQLRSRFRCGQFGEKRGREAEARCGMQRVAPSPPSCVRLAHTSSIPNEVE